MWICYSLGMYKTIGIGGITILIIVLMYVIPKVFHHPSPPTDTGSTKQVKADATAATIKISAISFYEEYDKCIKDSSQTISSCLRKNTNSSTQLMKDKDTSNPICGEVLPDSFSVSKVTTKETTSQVEVVESSGNTYHKILLLLGKENNKWKVQKISCPRV